MSRKGKPISLERPSPAVLTHGRPATHSELTLPAGAAAASPPTAGKPPYRVPSMAEIGPGEPAPAILQYGTSWDQIVLKDGPTERRKLTIAELKRICAFPDDFVLTGSYNQQWERLGRAVPPVMMCHVATALRGELCKLP